MISIMAKKTLTALALLFTLSTPVIATQTEEQKPPSDSSTPPTNSGESVVELQQLREKLSLLEKQNAELKQLRIEEKKVRDALAEERDQQKITLAQLQKEKEESVTSLEQLRQEAEKQKELLVQEKEELKTGLEKLREEQERSSKEKEEQLVQVRKEKEEALGAKGVLESELSHYKEAFAPQVGSLLERARGINPDPFKVETLVTDCTQTDTLSKEAGELMETLREMSAKYEKSISSLSPVFPALAKHKDGDRAAILLYLKAARETLDNDTERLSRSVRTLCHLHNVTKVTPSDHTTNLLKALAGLDAILKSELQLSESQAKEQIESFLKMIGYIK